MRRILEAAVKDDPPAKRASFLALAAQLRRETEGRAQLMADASVAVERLVAEEDSDAAHRLAASGDDQRALLRPKETRPAKGAKLKEGQPASPPARQPASPPARRRKPKPLS